MGRRRYHADHSAKQCGLTCGGLSRSWFLLGYRFSSSIPLGLRFRERIISLAITFRRFIRPKFSAIRLIAGLDRNQVGGQPGCFFLPRCWFSGLLQDSVSPAITIAAHTTKPSGPIRRRVLSVSRA